MKPFEKRNVVKENKEAMNQNEFDNGMNGEENNDMFEDLRKKLKEMSEIAFMCANAPKDQNGNAVVSVVGIKNFGMFYLFEN